MAFEKKHEPHLCQLSGSQHTEATLAHSAMSNGHSYPMGDWIKVSRLLPISRRVLHRGPISIDPAS